MRYNHMALFENNWKTLEYLSQPLKLTRNFIVDWLKTAISTGAFKEHAADDGSSSILCEDEISQSSDDPGNDTVSGHTYSSTFSL